MQRAYIVVGLGYGDESKGSWVDHLVRRHGIRYVVRFNGGAQAMHHVVTPEGRVHGFAQFGSGTFVDGTHTILSRFMLVEPEALLAEAYDLEMKGVNQPLDRMMVCADAPLITPFNRMLNQVQEIFRGRSRHGSCGFGIGITQNDLEVRPEHSLRVQDIVDGTLEEKLRFNAQLRFSEAQNFKCDENEVLRATMMNADIDYYVRLFEHFYHRIMVIGTDDLNEVLVTNDVVFEGAQGVLLDQDFGFFPYVTRSKCTFDNAHTLLDEANFTGEIEKIGLLRAYGTRHGAGPFVTEDPLLHIEPCHNGANPWQGNFRTGWFDAVAARYALECVGGVDTLAISNTDRMVGLPTIKVCTRYSNADPRFFSPDRIQIMPFDREISSTRSRSISSILPLYEQVEGWGHDSCCTRGLERYLHLLAELTEHPIRAYSATAGHQKVYQTF